MANMPPPDKSPSDNHHHSVSEASGDPSIQPPNSRPPVRGDRAGKLGKFRPMRSQFRDRSHDSAHSDAANATGSEGDAGEGSADVEEAPDRLSLMPNGACVPRGPAALITRPSELAELISHLRGTGSFAYDSEFIGELSYVPKLCLIQVASRERIALVDPLADLDLHPFWEIVCDPAVEKIVHAGQQDLEPVYRRGGCTAANIFDTQISAGFIGLNYPLALSKLVKELLGVRLGKGLTFTHWDQRPLSAMQLRYAADDVRYLPALRQTIGERLAKLGHDTWAAEECAVLCDPAMYHFDPRQQYLRVRGVGTLSAAGVTILRELVIFRDAAAKIHDMPARSFLKDEVLLELSRNPPKTSDRLQRVKGLPRPVEQAHGKEIIETIARALTAPAIESVASRQFEESPTDRFRTDALWAIAECLAMARSIDPNLLANRQEIGHLYHHLAGGGDAAGDIASEIRLLRGWRRQGVGDALIAMFQKGTAAAFTWRDGTLQRHPGGPPTTP